MLKYISNEDHYTEVIERSLKVKQQLWIGTADIKDLYIKSGLSSARPYLDALAKHLHNGVSIRMLFAKEPGPNFKNDFDKYPLLIEHLETAVCPRVHFKIFVFDLKEVYIGSANLTGAGLGMKSARNRNFEAGILTDDPSVVQQAINQFDQVWMGRHCSNCGRKSYCPLPIIEI